MKDMNSLLCALLLGSAVATASPVLAGSPARADKLPAQSAQLTSQKEWGRAVNRAIARQMRFTPEIRALGKDQVIHVRMTVSPDGSVREAHIVRSSGNDMVDQAALDMVTRAGKLPPFSSDMEKRDIRIELPIHMKTEQLENRTD